MLKNKTCKKYIPKVSSRGQTWWHRELSALWPALSPADQRPSSLTAVWGEQRASPANPPCAARWSPPAFPGTCWTPDSTTLLSTHYTQRLILLVWISNWLTNPRRNILTLWCSNPHQGKAIQQNQKEKLLASHDATHCTVLQEINKLYALVIHLIYKGYLYLSHSPCCEGRRTS